MNTDLRPLWTEGLASYICIEVRDKGRGEENPASCWKLNNYIQLPANKPGNLVIIENSYFNIEHWLKEQKWGNLPIAKIAHQKGAKFLWSRWGQQ